MKPCRMELRGEHHWCFDHKKYHKGHLAKLALDPGEKGAAYRRLWSGIKPDKPPEKGKPPLTLAGCCFKPGKEPLQLAIHFTVNASGFGTQVIPVNRESSGMVKIWTGYGMGEVKGSCTPCGDFPAKWHSLHQWYFNLMCTGFDGPLEAMRLTLEHYTEISTLQVVSAKLNLLSCDPFLAVGSGLFACSDIAASNTPCKQVAGATWSATVTEVVKSA